VARALKEVTRLDRRWFWHAPRDETAADGLIRAKVDLCDGDRRAGLLIAISYLARGHIVYQPGIFRSVLPEDERSAAALFALAATSPEPIPEVARRAVSPLCHGLCQQTLD
jgi:hypothetical protein